jgi:hypothetical protein
VPYIERELTQDSQEKEGEAKKCPGWRVVPYRERELTRDSQEKEGEAKSVLGEEWCPIERGS